MRIAIITESFPPDVNGVAHSVVRVAEHLLSRGHTPLVIAPQPASGCRAVTGQLPYPVIRVPSLPTPGYPSFRLGLPSRRIAAALREHRADLVHLASPFVLGARGVSVARGLGLPTVAVYQTDVPAYAALYRGFGWGEEAAWRWLRRIHNAADRTLAPSTATATALMGHDIERVWLWRRGVDAARFTPQLRSPALRSALAPGGEVIVGYVGRLAPEKRVDLLAPVTRLPGVRVVIVGDGPARASLRRAMPDAVFLGARHGGQLARLYASFDVFAHTGPYETFGQTVQEALASGLPVVAPAAGGPLDLVEPGRTGYLVPPCDAAALTGAVAGLVADPARRAEFGANARAAVEGRGWAAVGDELIGHYVAVHGGSPATRVGVAA
ncbi:glycosyltransferase family 4 protein [Planosporangium mesophilum]|uniref:GDP-mannose-dependent alpha-mannosyltransferase n=1 Tax=Planosporangium mesophilum TaxID=689768 RepID=A0A8J3X2I7_9ACTN|nr:glycosyltransferase family 1 protein [Planosporangium mesophilum]NJC86015.1 glycosyltransferase family 1 protein [Planosporangium mesophilum]GII25522.1 GDP-mannose-dependent alpha-mannosyltransferase [Planosporangium mesophilum]